MSLCFVHLPKLRRKEPWASWGFNPIAKSTWLGSNLVEEQAEPVEAATPNKSS